jgi:hypothetical protein
MNKEEKRRKIKSSDKAAVPSFKNSAGSLIFATAIHFFNFSSKLATARSVPSNSSCNLL